MTKKKPVYALYQGDLNICDGTIDEIAAHQHVKRDSISFLKTPSGKRRHDGGLCLVLIEEDDCFG